VSATTLSSNGYTPKAKFDRQQVERHRASLRKDDEFVVLTEEEKEQFKILRYCAKQFEDACKARKPFETFDICWALFNGDMWNDRRPVWRASITINKIRAFITFMQAVMTDNKPRISVEPLVPGSEDASDLLRKLVDRDWDENQMQQVISTWVLYGLIWGYAFVKVTYDPYADGGRGKHCAVPIPPYRIYTNRTATCIEDAEFIVHVEDVTMGWIRRNFPDKAEAASTLRGIRLNDNSDADRNKDYVREGTLGNTRIQSAMDINGNIIMPQQPMSSPHATDEDRDTIEVAEHWMRDDSLESYERQVVENGRGKFQPVIKDGSYVMEVVGSKTIISEIDGQPTVVPVRRAKMEPVTEKAWRLKYPNGRLVIIAGGKILLRDIPSPFQIDGFPFAMWKDYDVGGFHGQGEPLPLRSCAFAINKIASQVFEILEKTGNPSWKVKKDGGVNLTAVKNRPGLVIAMDTPDALTPLEKPPIPQEFFSLYKLISDGMGEVSGVNESVKGALPAANTAFATMDQLQESGSAPLRLKVRNMETGISRIGKLRIQLIQQFDQGARPLRLTGDDLAAGVVEPASNVSVQFRKYSNADIQGQVEFGVVPISSLSTSPAGTWNKWMTLLDKKLVDPVWWHSKFRIEGYKSELPRMLKQQKQDADAEAALKKASKVGGNRTSPAKQASRRRLPPPSQSPTREENARVR